MTQPLVYSRRQRRRAINFAALLGWFGTSAVMLQGNWHFILFAAILGLPVAFALCWAIGAPLLSRAMRREITWLKATLTGGAIAACIATLSIVFGRLQGLSQSRNPRFNSHVGGGDHIREIDGILTPYGWLVVAQNTLLFIVMGAAIGLILWWLIGKPQGLAKD